MGKTLPCIQDETLRYAVADTGLRGLYTLRRHSFPSPSGTITTNEGPSLSAYPRSQTYAVTPTSEGVGWRI